MNRKTPATAVVIISPEKQRPPLQAVRVRHFRHGRDRFTLWLEATVPVCADRFPLHLVVDGSSPLWRRAASEDVVRTGQTFRLGG